MKIPVPMTKETTPDKAIIPTAFVIEPKVVGIQPSMGGILVAMGETAG